MEDGKLKIAVIGAGLTGLAAAWKLSKKHDIIMLEKEPFLGGMASSYIIPWDGKEYKITKTYHHILEGDFTTIEFIRDLGLFDGFRKKKVKQGFIHRNKIWGFSTPIEVLKFPLPLIDKVLLARFILLDSKNQDWNKLKGMNAQEWVVAKAGKNNFDTFFDHLIRNKFQTSAENISAAWLGTRFFKESSSLLKKFGWLEGGIDQIVEGLATEIKKNGGTIVTEAKISEIKDGKVIYSDSFGKKEINVDVIVSTIAPELLLKLTTDLPKDLEKRLRKIEYLCCACACFGLKEKFNLPYWSNVLDKDKPFTVIFNHTTLYEDSAPSEKSVVYISAYMSKENSLWNKSENEIAEIYTNAMENLIPGFRVLIEWRKVFKVENAEAIYSINFENPPVSFKNFYFGGIYRIYPKIRNMASALESGLEVAEKVENDFCV
ncbi:MAG: FAD-dependent oxidoreductase [Methanotrichaceae archaeon]|nr:FAD-dependent oxidoreductase [Methanotrichaceae archaeon]